MIRFSKFFQTRFSYFRVRDQLCKYYEIRIGDRNLVIRYRIVGIVFSRFQEREMITR